MEIDKFIKFYNGGTKVETISSIIKFLSKKAKWKDAEILRDETGEKLNKKIRDTKCYNFQDGSYSGIHWMHYLRFIITRYFREYTQENSANVEEIVSLEALKYGVGGHYVPHIDHCLSIPRTISCILFLNNEYEGGEINFHDPHDYKKIYKTVKPKPGACLMWPSNFIYPHSVSPVTKGTRYVIVSWLT